MFVRSKTEYGLSTDAVETRTDAMGGVYVLCQVAPITTALPWKRWPNVRTRLQGIRCCQRAYDDRHFRSSSCVAKGKFSRLDCLHRAFRMVFCELDDWFRV